MSRKIRHHRRRPPSADPGSRGARHPGRAAGRSLRPRRRNPVRRQGPDHLTGIGKSGHVARKIAATLASTGTPAMFVHAAEASHGDLGMIAADDVSWSLCRNPVRRANWPIFSPMPRRFGISDDRPDRRRPTARSARPPTSSCCCPTRPKRPPRSAPRRPRPRCRSLWATLWPWPCWSGAALPPAISVSFTPAASSARCCARSAT